MFVFVCQSFCLFSYTRVGTYGSKDSESRRTSKFHDRFKRYDYFTDVFQPADKTLRVKICLLRELVGEGLWLWMLALVTGGR